MDRVRAQRRHAAAQSPPRALHDRSALDASDMAESSMSTNPFGSMSQVFHEGGAVHGRCEGPMGGGDPEFEMHIESEMLESPCRQHNGLFDDMGAPLQGAVSLTGEQL